MTLDLLPMLLLSLFLMTSGGTPVETVELMLSGEHMATTHRGGLVVGDAQVTVPAGTELTGPVHLLGGVTRIHGTVAGDVTLFGGRLVVADGAAITGTLQHIGGTSDVSPAATVARRSTLDVVPAAPDPVQRVVSVLIPTGVLAAVGAWRAHRRPGLLDNVAAAAGGHPVVSLTVGALVTVTFLSLFVFMAFTLVLVPVTVIGLVAGVVVAGYGVVGWGHLVGRHLPITGAGGATAVGVVVVMAVLWLLGTVPVVGDPLAMGALLTGFGAVIVTYFGLKEFTPAALPE